MWPFSRKGPSGFSSSSTAEEVTQGIDANGLTAIVTGASSGIGTETTRVLALRGVRVIMAVRNMAAGKGVREALVKEVPTAKVDTMELDLSSLSSVRKFASDFKSSGHPLNILMSYGNSIHAFQRQHRTTVCHKSLRPFSSDKSLAGYNEENSKAKYSSGAAYGQSKLANVLHANELARRLKEDGATITANSLHPGAIQTNLFRHLGFINGLVNTIGRLVLKNVQQGAATTCYVALHPQVKGLSGEYFVDSNLSEASSKGKDPELAKKLWDFSKNLTK
ncbi:Short-chain dehydrogenase TIC 32 [Morus notabilis]|uniref:Short-chain dehydrogenase TIC 32 n=1 Tax=Morus notabilis TaxID=981085 RepID=W9S807_9ROSA|nr:Short-chain dehydrogenase TIC 32 [Morus notabilis]